MTQNSLYQFARSFNGLRELPGKKSHPLILGMIQEFLPWADDDSTTAWCALFVSWCVRHFMADAVLPEKPWRARSWMAWGQAVPLVAAQPGDLVILKRDANGPGPDVVDAIGHIGFYVKRNDEGHVTVYGGNQSDRTRDAVFPVNRILAVRRP